MNTTNIINYLKNRHVQVFAEIEPRINQKRKKTVPSKKNKGQLDESSSSDSASDYDDVLEYNSIPNDSNTSSTTRYFAEFLVFSLIQI